MKTKAEKFRQALQEAVKEIQGCSTEELKVKLDDSGKTKFAKLVDFFINPCNQNNNQVE